MGNNNVNGKAAKSMTEHFSLGHKAIAVAMSVVMLGFGWPAVSPANSFAENDTALTQTATGEEASGSGSASASAEKASSAETKKAESSAASSTKSDSSAASKTAEGSDSASSSKGSGSASSSSSAQSSEQKATQADVELDLGNAYITYNKQDISLPATKVTVPTSKDFKFTATAIEGYELTAVKLTVNGVERELTPNDEEVYTVEAADVLKGASLKLETEQAQNSQANEDAISITSLEDEIAVADSSNSRWSGGNTATFNPTISNADVAYFNWHSASDTSSISFTPVASGGTLSISDYNSRNQAGYVVFFVKPNSNYLFTGLGAAGNGDTYVVGSGEYGNIAGYPNISAVMTAAKAAGYVAAFGYSRVKGDNPPTNSAFQVTAQSPDMSIVATSSKTSDVLAGETLTFTIVMTPQLTGSNRDKVTGVHVNGVTVNGLAAECSDIVDNGDGTFTATVSYTVTEADCNRSSVDLMVNATSTYEASLSTSLSAITTTSSISKTATATCAIAPKSDVTYDFKSGTSDKVLPNGIYKLLPKDSGQYQVGKKVKVSKDLKSGTVYEDAGNDGYWTFDGWDADSKTMTEDGITFLGTWNFTEYSKYTIKYVDEDGNEIADSKTVTGNKVDDKIKVSDIEKPTIAGYSFSKVSPTSELKIKSDDSQNVITLTYKKKAGKAGYYLVLGNATWNAPSDTTQESGSQKWYYNYGFAKGDTFQVATSTPSADNHVFIGWMDKERDDQAAAIRAAGETVTYCYSKNQTYTLDALWASLSATGEDVTYDGKSHTVTVDVNINEGTGLDSKYVEQAKKLITTGDIEYSTDGGVNWSKDKPTFKDAGTYTVKARQNVTVGEKTTMLTAETQVKIAQKEYWVETSTDSKKYDSKELAGTATVKGLIEGESATATATTIGPDVTASTTNAVTGQIVWADNTKASNYKHGTDQLGKLEIAKRSITLTSASAEKAYDGAALTNSDVTVSGDGFVDGEGATYNVTGSQTEVGSSANEFNYTLNAKTKAGNYDITKSEGTLKVTNRADKYEVTVTANSDVVTYNGEKQAVSGLSGTTYTNGKGVTFTISGLSAGAEGTDAGEYTSKVTGTAVVTDAAGNVVTEQFKITTVDGKLTINKKDATITAGTAEKEYDGTALTTGEFTTDGFVEGEGIESATIEGSQTVVGSTQSTVKANSWKAKEGTDLNNYNITTQPGTLTVKDRTAKYQIELEGVTATKTYDGSEQTMSGVKSETFEFNGETFQVKNYKSDITGNDAGDYTQTITSTNKDGSWTVVDSAGNDVSAQFSVSTKTGKLTIAPKDVTITSGSATKTYDGKALTKAEASVTDGGFVVGEEAGVSYNNFASRTDAGTSENTFDVVFDGTTAKASNYKVTKKPGTLTVDAVSDKVTVTITEHGDALTYDGDEHTVTGYDVSSDNKLYTTKDFAFSGNASVSGTDAGTYNMELKAADFRNTSANFANVEFVIVDGTLTINKRAVELTSGSSQKVYDGTALTNSGVTVTNGCFAKSDSFTSTTSGTITNVGSEQNAFTYELTGNGAKKDDAGNYVNYTVTTKTGNLVVTPVTSKVTVTIAGDKTSTKYDGTAKSASGYTASIDNALYKETDFTYTGSSEVTKTDAGTYAMGLKDGKFENKSNNFTDVEFVVTDGELAIAKRDVTLKSADLSKPYDGTALTNGETALATEAGWVDGQGATYTFTGSQTVVGSSDNAFNYTLNDNTKADNYNITKTEGSLKVTNRDAKYSVTVKANSTTATYDGSEHAANGVETYEFTVNGQKYTVSGLTTQNPKATDAGTYTNNITGTPVVKDANGNDVSSQFSVETENGSLVIEKAAVTLKSASGEWTYDGSAHSKDEMETVSGFAQDEGASYTYGVSITNAGKVENSFTYQLNDNTKAENYTIKTENGTLKVNPVTNEVTIKVKGNQKTETYNGSEQEATGFSVQGTLPSGLAAADVVLANGATASAKGTNVGTYYMNLSTDSFGLSEQASKNFENVKFEVEDGKLEITPADKIGNVTWSTQDVQKVYDGTALSAYTASATDAYGNKLTVEYSTDGKKWVSDPSEITLTHFGSAPVQLRATGSNYKEGVYATSSESIAITKRLVTLTSATDSKVFDGTPLTNGTVAATAKGDGVGFIDGEGVSFDVTGSQTAAGTSDNTFTYSFNEGTDGNDYLITKKAGKLTVTADANEVVVTIKGNSDTVTYDGAAHSVSGYQVSVTGGEGRFTADDIALKEGVDLSVSGTDVAVDQNGSVVAYTKALNASDFVSTNENFSNVKFVIDQTAPSVSLTINKRNVTLTSETDEKPYDGTVLTRPDVTGWQQSGDTGFVTGEVSDVKATGSITMVGEPVTNTITYTPGASFKATNYNVVKEEGTLTITPAGISQDEVKWTKNDVVKTYDGQTYSAGTATATDKFGNALTVEYSTDGKNWVSDPAQFTAKDVADSKTIQLRATNGNYKDHATSTEALTINKRSVTLTSDSETKPYDGTALERPAVTGWQQSGDTGFVTGEVSDVKATGSVTNYDDAANKVDNNNKITYTEGDAFKAGNYTIEKNEGTLRITLLSAEENITVNGSNTSYVYDSYAHPAGTATATAVDNDDNPLAADFHIEYRIKGGADTEWRSNPAEITWRNAYDSPVTVEIRVWAKNFEGYKYGEETITITKRPVQLKTKSASKVYDGTPLTTVNDWDGYAVLPYQNGGFQSPDLAIGSDGYPVLGCTGSQTEVGSSSNTITYQLKEGCEGNYEIAKPELGTLTVTAQSIVPDPSNPDSYKGVTITDPSDVVYNGTEQKWVPEVKDASGKALVAGRDYTVAYSNDVTNVGTVTVTIQGIGNYAGTSTKTYKITPAPLTVSTPSASKVYDGTALTAAATDDSLTGLVNGETAAVAANGSQTNVGSSENGYTINWGTAKESNYYIQSENKGTLTVTAKSIVPDPEGKGSMTVNDPSDATYDGQEHKWVPVVKDGDKVLVEGTDYEVSYNNRTDFTNADGTITVTIIGKGNYSGSFDRTYQIKKAPLSVVTESGSKSYDGQALTAGGTIGGFVNGESAAFKVTGSQTTVGSSTNTYEIDWTRATAKQGNYEISEQLGTLTVTESANEVVVTTTGGTWTYDGQPHGATVAVTNLPAGYTAQATSNATATDANGEGIAATADNLVIRNTEGADVTNDLKVTKVDGAIRIKPAELSVETFSAKKSYDGSALTASGKVSGLVGSEAATLVATGSQTVVGKSDNTYRIEWNDNAKESNYTIASENIGTLEVTANTTPIYVVPTGATKVYDGTALEGKDTTAMVMGVPNGFTSSYTLKGSQTDKGQSYVEIDTFKIFNAAGDDVTSNFSGINTEFKGSLNVTARPVTLTSASASKVYDGTELTAHAATASEPAKDTGMVAGQAFDLEFFGSQTAEGSSANTFVAKSSSTADVNNYSITYINGTLAVGKQAITPGTDPENPDPAYKGIEISSPENVVYDASEHKWSPEVTDKDGNKLVEGTDYEVSYSTADFTNATGAITVTITGKGNYTGTVTKTYEITKRPVTLTSESQAFTYNGQAQGWNEYECTDKLFASQVDGLGCTATVTNAGETAENTVGYTFKTGFSENNYNVTKQFGTLSVTAQSIDPGTDPENPDPAYQGVKVSSPEDKTYNGTEQKWAPEVTDANGDALTEGTDYEVSYSTDNFTDVTGAITVTITGKGNYTGTVERTYQIQPKGYTVATESAGKVYDGKDLTAGGKIEGIVAGEDAGFAVTGSQTNAGSSSNTYEVKWNGNAKKDNYKLEKETLGTLEVTRAAVTVTAETASKVYGTSDPTFTAKVTGLVNGESADLITYSVARQGADEAAGTYTGVIVPAGEATQGNYTVAYVPGNFMITRSDELTVVGTNYEGAYDGKSHGSAATVSVTEGTTVEYSTDGGDTWSQTAPTVKDVADVTVKVRATNPNYKQAETAYTLKVTPKGYTVTTGTDTKVYDGTPLTAGGSIVGIVNGEDAGFQVTGSQAEVGESKNTYEIKWNGNAEESNYELLGETVGTLTVTAQSIDPGIDPENPDPTYKGVQVGQLSNVEYNGKAQEQKPSVADKDGNPLTEGVDYEISFSKDTVNAGEVTVIITGKGNYTGTVERTYQITPKGYTVVTDSAEKVYDGVELTAGGKIDGILDGEDAGFQVTGSQTGVGSSGNTYVISWSGNAKKNNYTLASETVGSLKVTPQSIDPGTDPENPDPAYKGVEVGLIPNVEYNGKSQEQKPSVTDKDGNPLTEGVDYKVSISEDTTNAGTVTVKIEGIGNYSGTVERTYQITPKGYTVVTDSADKVYDGAELTAPGKIEGIVDGEDAGFQVTGSQTEVGESKNTYQVKWNASAKQSNYTLTSESVGTLTVTASDELSVSGTDYVGVYDGSVHGVAAVATVQEGTTVEYSTDGGNTWSTDVPTVKDVSEVAVKVRATNPNYSEATAEYILKVTPAPLSIVTGSATKVYDGSALTSTDMAITGLVNGETLIARTTGSQTEVGSSANTYALAGGTASLANYEVTETLGTLTVTAAVAPTPDNTPGNNPGNASGNNPVANNVARALADTFTAVTGEEATATPEEQIYDEENPLGAESHSCWVHFYMLIGMVLTALYGLFVAFRRGNHTHQLKKDMNDVMGDGGDDGKDPVATTKPAGTEA